MIKMHIAGFCLGGTRTLLYKLNCVNSCYILFENNLKHYLKMIAHDKPDAVLGLGTYSGRDQDKIRVETRFTNQFRNDYIDGDLERVISISPFFKLSDRMKLATAAGNSWCNMFSYKIVTFIQDGHLETDYSFLHVPNKIKWWQAKKIIDQTLG
jgi:pyrrolidone-carboxylate peptidase